VEADGTDRIILKVSKGNNGKAGGEVGNKKKGGVGWSGGWA